MNLFKRLIVITVLTALDVNCHGQLIYAKGGPINDFYQQERNDTFFIAVDRVPNNLSAEFGLAKVCINLSHDRISDLKIELISPDGTKVWLSNRNGGLEGRNYLGTCFRSNGFNSYIRDADLPYTGEYIPDGRMEFFNNGQSANGIYKMVISDLRAGISGKLNGIYLYFEEIPNPNLNKSRCEIKSASGCDCSNSSGQLLPDLVLIESITKRNIYHYGDDHDEFPSQIRFAASIGNFGEGPVETFGKKEWYCGEQSVADETVRCSNGKRPRQQLYQKIYKKTQGSDTLQFDLIKSGTNYFDEQPGHQHYHVDDWVDIELFKRKKILGIFNKRKLISKGTKVSYCLFDSGICNSADSLCIYKDGTKPKLANYGLGNYTSCDAGFQGISVGGYDTYGFMYEGQNLLLPKNLPDGKYELHLTIDPHNYIKEINEKNNKSVFVVDVKN